MVIAVTGSASLAGLTVGLFGISRFLVSYPVGKITDTYGRKPGILFGQGLALIGSFVSGLAMLAGSAIGLTLGMIIFTSGISAGAAVARRRDRHVSAAPARPGAGLHRHRLAGRHRAEPAGDVARRSDRGSAPATSALGLPWLMMPVLILGGMILVFFVQSRSEGDRHEPGALLSGLHAAAEACARPGGGVQLLESASSADDAACDPFELRRAGQHGDRHGADLAGAVASRPRR